MKRDYLHWLSHWSLWVQTAERIRADEPLKWYGEWYPRLLNYICRSVLLASILLYTRD